jgi:kynureninase
MSPRSTLEQLAQEKGLSWNSIEFAKSLDASDNLQKLKLREEFAFPKVKAVQDTAAKSVTAETPSGLSDPASSENELGLKPNDDCVYMIGNSLGLQPLRTRKLLNEELDVWAERLVGRYLLCCDIIDQWQFILTSIMAIIIKEG